MSDTVALPRGILVFLIVLPVAALVGYLLATPDDFGSITLVGAVVLTLLVPIWMQWHHPLLVLSWNASISLFFLPGQPSLWMGLAILSLGFSMLNRLMGKRNSYTHVPSIAWPLIGLVIVALITAQLTGGIGFRAFGGGTFGGKRYAYILLAVIGFFALASQRIPQSKASLFVGLFLLSGLTAMMSNLIYFSKSLWFLYYLFPPEIAYEQAAAERSVTSSILRLTGMAIGGPAIYYWLLCRHGIQGLLAPTKAWRLLIFLAALFVTMLGGFRSNPLMLGIFLCLLLFFEGVHHTRLFIGMMVVVVGVGIFVFAMVDRLPMPVQRALSFLPIEVSPIAKYEADATTEWRLAMWRILMPEVPKHLLLGKGYGIDPTEVNLMKEAVVRGHASHFDATIAVGNYHNGPLTLIIPLGLAGMLAFLCFAGASLRYLYKQYQSSPRELRLVNTFLLCYFGTRLFYFLVCYGHFAEDLFIFTGIIGLSISINGPLAKRSEVRLQPASAPTTSLEPALA